MSLFDDFNYDAIYGPHGEATLYRTGVDTPERQVERLRAVLQSLAAVIQSPLTPMTIVDRARVILRGAGL